MNDLEHKYDHMKKINKGWSTDDKYQISLGDKHYLLRVSTMDKYERIKSMFDLLKKVDDLSIPMCKPISLKVINHQVHCLYTWIYGDELIHVIDHISEKDQYDLGELSGQYLQKIHLIPAPDHLSSWESRYNQKINRNISKFEKSQLDVPEIYQMIEYINQHRHLLQSRPQSFHHGDFHVGNIMINSNLQLTIIDFEKYDFGDPWEEFNRIVWSAQKSPAFASGMINGYFNDHVPDEFWKLLLLYISSNTISSLTWGLAFSKEEYETMLNQMHDILDWYDDFKRIVPKWYSLK